MFSVGTDFKRLYGNDVHIFILIVFSVDIKSWFERSTNALDDVRKASSADFQQLAKGLDVDLPSQLDFLLSECNGGLWFMEKRMLTAQEIVKTVCNFSSAKTWRNDMIPFAEDGSGSEALLVYLVDSGKVCEWEEDSGIEDERGAPTLSQFLEKYRNQLLSGKCSYDEGLGVIESVGNSAGSCKVSRK